MPQAISNLPIEAKIKDANTKFLGEVIVWQIADKNHKDFPSNSVTLTSEKALRAQVYDKAGNPAYEFSNIRQWLNKAGTPWFVATTSGNVAPDGTNRYDNIDGFLSNFSPQLRSALLPTSLSVAGTTVIDEVFLASATEMGYTGTSDISDISYKYAIFSDAASRKCYPTAACVNANQHASGPSSTASSVVYWTRTRRTSSSYQVKIVMGDGSVNHNPATYPHYCFRPCFNISNDVLVSDSADSNGVYTIIWNSAPTTPPSITVTDEIVVGKTVNISWGASTDPDGDTINYIVERSINGGTFAQVYSGTARECSHSVATSYSTLQYRVKAVDSKGASSGWRTSAIHTVIIIVPELATMQRKAFLLSRTEITGFASSDGNNSLAEGKHLNAVFDTQAKRIAYLESAPGVAGDWWTRTAELLSSSKSAIGISQNGAAGTAQINTARYLRPAITLPNNYYVYEDGTVHESDEARLFEFADEYSEKIRAVMNNGDVPIGFVMLMYAEDGDFGGIHIRNLTSGEYIDMPNLTIAAGDTLEISTRTNEKWVRVLRAGGTQEFVFASLSDSSTFFELDFGQTQIKVWADTGDEHMRATLITVEQFVSL